MSVIMEELKGRLQVESTGDMNLQRFTQSFSRTNRAVKIAASIVLAVVLVSSFTLSYTGLVRLAAMAKFEDITAHIFPIAVDGMLLMASLFSMSGRKSKLAKLIMVWGVIISIGGNTLAAVDAGYLALIHSIPPSTFLLSMLLFESLITARTKEEERVEQLKMKAEQARAKQALREAKRSRPVAQVQPQDEGTAETGERGQGEVKAPIATATAPTASPAPIESKKEETTAPALPMTAPHSPAPMGTKKALIKAYLVEHPDATPSEVARHLGVEAKTIKTQIYRVKGELAEEAKGQEEPIAA